MINDLNIKVTDEILWRGAFFFALIDIFFIYFLSRLTKPPEFFRMKWRLLAVMLVFFFILFNLIISYLFWDTVYSYVFPSWTKWIIPPIYALLFTFVGLLLWWLALKFRGNAVVNFCLLGGVWGILSHILAISRGILDKPPMLQGCSAIAAIGVATFEFIFYWCACLSLTKILLFIEKKFIKSSGKFNKL